MALKSVQGKRVYLDKKGQLTINEYEYGYDPALDMWVVWPPNCEAVVVSPDNVILHEDGTISINHDFFHLIFNDEKLSLYHGCLKYGIWGIDDDT